MDRGLLDHDRLKRRAGAVARGIAELADRLHDLHSLGDLAEDAVIRRETRSCAGDDEELAAGGAGRLVAGFRHGNYAGAVGGARRDAVARGVAGATRAARRGIAALDHEAGDDAVEDRVVEEPVARERGE